MSQRVQVEYFALFREQAGCAGETVETAAANPGQLYAELAERHGLTLEPGRLKVAVNDRFVGWDAALADGDRVVFIPPVAGG
jgi:molybdopterin converting factor subunit 1